MNNVLVLDVETSTNNKGNPFDRTNKCVCVGIKDTKGGELIGYLDDFEAMEHINAYIQNSYILVGFNIKFDLHWLRRIGIDISKIKVWDCQLAEFILNNQQTPYPSLDQAAEKYSLPKKLDVVKTEYWEKGIDTDKIPREVLTEYLEQDLNLTQQVFEKQMEQFKTDPRAALFKLQCADLLVLEEMEWNGIVFNTKKALEKAKEIEKELIEISTELSRLVGGVPCNFNSNDHLSAILYGGTILEDVRIPIGVYKTGGKVGQTRYKIITKEYTLPRLITPLKGTETVKSKKRTAETGVEASQWEVNDTVLRKVKLNKEAKIVVDLIKKHSVLDKLRGTYLQGYSDLINKMNWPEDKIHGTLNQCVAITGRLSSNKPNLQNADPLTKRYMESRYDN